MAGPDGVRHTSGAVQMTLASPVFRVPSLSAIGHLPCGDHAGLDDADRAGEREAGPPDHRAEAGSGVDVQGVEVDPGGGDLTVGVAEKQEDAVAGQPEAEAA